MFGYINTTSYLLDGRLIVEEFIYLSSHREACGSVQDGMSAPMPAPDWISAAVFTGALAVGQRAIHTAVFTGAVEVRGVDRPDFHCGVCGTPRRGGWRLCASQICSGMQPPGQLRPMRVK